MGEDKGGASKGQGISFDEAVSYVLLNYSQITLKHFTSSFREGGITEKQFESLFYTCTLWKHRERQHHAALQGIDLPDLEEISKEEKTGTRTQPVRRDEIPSFVEDTKHSMFCDPSEYEHLSQEERQALTEKMMGNHKNWVQEQNAKSKV